MNHIIADIHGCYYTLLKLIDKIRLADRSPQLIFVGDYVDRGLRSKDVVETMISLQNEGAICLRGNHDDVIDWLLNKHSASTLREMVVGQPTDRNVVGWWLQNGLATTLVSYGVKLQEFAITSGPYNEDDFDYAGIAEEFRRVVPDAHKSFFENLKMFWMSDTHFACHGWLPPRYILPRDSKFIPSSLNHEILWNRFHRMADGYGIAPVYTKWDRVGVFGHTPVQFYHAAAPIKWDKIRLIDCSAFTGEYLASYMCENDDHILAATDDRDMKDSLLLQASGF